MTASLLYGLDGETMLTLGEGDTFTWASFVADNAEAFEDAELAEIGAALSRGDDAHGGGGAMAEWFLAVVS
jgi:hypothetical protein